MLSGSMGRFLINRSIKKIKYYVEAVEHGIALCDVKICRNNDFVQKKQKEFEDFKTNIESQNTQFKNDIDRGTRFANNLRNLFV